MNIVRSIPIKTSNENDSSYGGEINEVILSDINQVGEITSTTKKTKVSKEFFSKSNIPYVKKGDLIISIKGSLGKIGTIVRFAKYNSWHFFMYFETKREICN